MNLLLTGSSVKSLILPQKAAQQGLAFPSANRLYRGMSDRYTIHVAGLEGEEITSYAVDRKKTKVPTSDKRDFFRKGNMPADVLKQIVDSLPDEVACFHRIEVHDNLVFVFVPEVDLENKMLRIRQIDGGRAVLVLTRRSRK